MALPTPGRLAMVLTKSVEAFLPRSSAVSSMPAVVMVLDLTIAYSVSFFRTSSAACSAVSSVQFRTRI